MKTILDTVGAYGTIFKSGMAFPEALRRHILYQKCPTPFNQSKTKLILALLVFVLQNLTYGDIIVVPSLSNPTIQSAIDSAQDGDTVLVSPGEYFENINFNGRDIILASNFILSGDTTYINNTIINGNENGSVITINSGEDSTTIIVGFTIKNGKSLLGGGIYCLNSDPSFRSLKINYNRVEANDPNHLGKGGGIYIKNCNSSFYKVQVEGNHIIDGTSPDGSGIYLINSSIRMDNSRIISNYGNGNGIGIYISNSSAVIDSCEISNNLPEYFSGHGGGLSADSAYLILKNTILSHNDSYTKGGGAYLSNMFYGYLENITVNNNRSGDGAGMYISNSIPFIVESEFENNNTFFGGDGGGLYLDYCEGYLNNVSFVDNMAENNGGAVNLNYSDPAFDSLEIINNVVMEGEGAGLYLNHSDPTIRRSLFYSNISNGDLGTWGRGCAIMAWNSSPVITNSTITFNKCTFYNYSTGSMNESPAAIEFIEDSNPIIINSILWNNYPNEIYDPNNQSLVAYSDIMGGWVGEGNLNQDPRFVDTTNINFELKNDSPCIDSGIAVYVINNDTIVYIPPDEYLGAAPDMGKYEYDFSSSIKNEVVNFSNYSLAQNYPNPFNPSTKIKFSIPQTSKVQIRIYDILGNEMASLVNDEKPAGTYESTWDASNLPSGVYIYQLVAGEFMSTKKMILLK